MSDLQESRDGANPDPHELNSNATGALAEQPPPTEHHTAVGLADGTSSYEQQPLPTVDHTAVGSVGGALSNEQQPAIDAPVSPTSMPVNHGFANGDVGTDTAPQMLQNGAAPPLDRPAQSQPNGAAPGNLNQVPDRPPFENGFGHLRRPPLQDDNAPSGDELPSGETPRDHAPHHDHHPPFGTHVPNRVATSPTDRSLRKSMTTIFRKGNEKWTLSTAARLIIMRKNIIKTFSDNRKAYQYICKTCKKLELHQSKFLVSQHSSDRREQAYSSLLMSDRKLPRVSGTSGSVSNRYNLGSMRSMGRDDRASCPFCKLILHSLEESKWEGPHENKIKQCRKDITKCIEEQKDRKLDIKRAREEMARCAEEMYECQAHIYICGDHVRKCDDSIDRGQKAIKEHEDNIVKWEKELQTLQEKKDRLQHQEDMYEKAEADYVDKVSRAMCYASFQMDGREVMRDKAGNVIDSRPRTRRIQLTWSHKDIKPAYIVLVAPEFHRGYDNDQIHLWESNTSFLARNIGTANKNDARVRRWVDLCRDHHGPSCNGHSAPDMTPLTSKAFFGVIDVGEMRLTSLPPGARYVALSYTWGQQKFYTTTTANIRLHQEHGGLDQVFLRLPKVIRDAIQLVRSLRERYLWVDSLCIVQKNEVSWNLNSSVMDLVYGNAYVTICAAEGEGAQVGLKGLDPNRTVSQAIEECAEGLRLTVSHLAETYVEKSRWSTRGWTFQERLLSRRCIIFVGDRVFFQCRSSALSEDINGEHESAGWSIELVQAPLQMLVDIGAKAFAVYMECVHLYTRRDLGNRKDILAAFRGMSNLIGREIGAPLHFGLPTSHFDLALLWEPTAACTRRVPTDDKEKTQFTPTSFPSWSWCGWSGSAFEYRAATLSGCLTNVSKWIAEHTWIAWHIRDGEGDLRPVWSPAHARPPPGDTWVDSRWLGYGSYNDPLCDEYGRVVKREWLYDGDRPLERTQFRRTLLEYPFGISTTPATPTATTTTTTTGAPGNGGGAKQQTYPDQPYLQFWTWSAHLRVTSRDLPTSSSSDSSSNSSDPDPNDTDLTRCDISDYCGDWCGTIVLNTAWIAQHSKSHPGEESVHEFIAISEAKAFSDEESDMWTYYIPKEREQAEWQLFYVLLVTRKGGICYRQGLGKVFKEAFAKSHLPGKEWKEIIMG